MAYFGVNFILQTFCSCKKNDKYQVCREHLSWRTTEQLSWRTKGHLSCRTGEHVSWRTGEYISSRTSENLCWKKCWTFIHAFNHFHILQSRIAGFHNLWSPVFGRNDYEISPPQLYNNLKQNWWNYPRHSYNTWKYLVTNDWCLKEKKVTKWKSCEQSPMLDSFILRDILI